MQADRKKPTIALLFILLFTLFTLTACQSNKEGEFGDKIVKDVVKSYMDMKKEARNNNNSVVQEKETVEEEKRDHVSSIMTARLEKMYDLLDDPLSGGYMKENFPDLEPIYSNANGTFMYYYTELADSTFKYWVRQNKVIAIKQGRRMGFD